MELKINESLLCRIRAIKERELNEVSSLEFHLLKLNEIGFRKCLISIKKNLKNAQ
jgi:hypothetical protein